MQSSSPWKPGVSRLFVMSGGQTGVDRAALDAAQALGIPIGGWCPSGRLAEDGPIPSKYPLKEVASKDYPVRTRANINDSDGTLIIIRGANYGPGTKLTLRCAKEANKPHLLTDLSDDPSPGEVIRWIIEQRICVLNVAGPRESGSPGIYAMAVTFLAQCFSHFGADVSTLPET